MPFLLVGSNVGVRKQRMRFEFNLASQIYPLTDVKSRVLDFTFQNPAGFTIDGILYVKGNSKTW